MAEDEAGEKSESGGSEEDTEQKSGKGKSLIILIITGLLLVGLSVGGTIFALKMFGASANSEDGEAPMEEELEPAKKPAIYYPMKPELLVTYQARGRRRYAQISITLMFRDDDVLAAVELHMPAILNGLNMIISGQIYEEVQTAEGKELLRLQCLEELQKIMQLEIGKPAIEQVLFTNFVMQ